MSPVEMLVHDALQDMRCVISQLMSSRESPTLIARAERAATVLECVLQILKAERCPS